MRVRVPLPIVGGLATVMCATALTPLFDGLRWWFGPATGATVVAVGAGSLARRVRLPVVLHPLLSLVGLLFYATVMSARSTAWSGLVPTGRTLAALRGLVHAGGADVRRLVAPVPDRPGVVLFVVAGVYIVAALVDLLAVTLRRPSLAGLPLLGLFAVPAAVLPGGVGTVPFVLGAAGYVALLLAEGRELIGRWGRPLLASARPGPIEASPPLGATGRRIGVAALASALVVPVVVPGIGAGLFNDKSGGLGDKGGSSSTSVVQPIVALYQQLHGDEDVPLLRVTTDSPQYLRLTALEVFDGQRFTLGRLQATRKNRVSQGVPAPEGGGTTTTVHTRIAVTDNLVEHYLPVPYDPVRVDRLSGDWRFSRPTRTIFSVHTDTSSASYQVTSQVPTPRGDELRGAIPGAAPEPGADIRLPSDLDPRIGRLARTVTRAATSQYDKVVALQSFLRSDAFTYDLGGAPTTNDGALVQFLLQTRRGYCEQFASAMVVLARSLGIPSRVAIGFTPGTRQPDGSWLITNKDAHAWPEVWFQGAGWVRFEPTKRSEQTTTPGYSDPNGLGGSLDQGAGGAAGSQQPGQQNAPVAPGGRSIRGHRDLSDSPADQARGAAGRSGGGTTMLVVATAAAAAALALLSPALIRVAVRRRRLGGRGALLAQPANAPSGAAAQVRRAWAELGDQAMDLGFPLRANDSPRAAARRLAARLPDRDAGGPGRAALSRLALAEEQARYAPSGTPLLAGQAVADVRTFARAVRAAGAAQTRVRATLAPPSTVGRLRRWATGGLADTLDSGDRLLGRAPMRVGRLVRRNRPRHRPV